MNIRTDLAKEIREKFDKNTELNGVSLHKYNRGNTDVSEIEIFTDEGADKMCMPKGLYITIEASGCLIMNDTDKNSLTLTIAGELQKVSKKKFNNNSPQNILVIGIGNRNITSDSVGPKVVDGITITGHINKYLNSLSEYKTSISAIAPGVMAQTGIETVEIIKGIVNGLKPELVIIIDALASRSLEHVNSTYQITDAGIRPGAGLGNNRHKIDEAALGVPVIAIGVPTIVSAETIIHDAIKNISNINNSDIQNIDTQSLNTQRLNAQSLNAQSPDTQSLDTQSLNTQSLNAQSPDTQSLNTQSPNTQNADTKNIDTQSPNTQSAEIPYLSFLKDKYVTTKNIDEEVLCVSRILQKAIDMAFLQKK